jgi:hypothetical protein
MIRSSHLKYTCIVMSLYSIPTNSHHEFNLKGSNNSYTFSTLIHIKYIMI